MNVKNLKYKKTVKHIPQTGKWIMQLMLPLNYDQIFYDLISDKVFDTRHIFKPGSLFIETHWIL